MVLFMAYKFNKDLKGHNKDCLFSHKIMNAYISNNPISKDLIMAFRNNNKPYHI